jgi:hypothetical protein
MPDYQPVNPTNTLPKTRTAGAAITGGQLLLPTADSVVSPVTANTQRATSVAAHDAPSGGRVTVWPLPGVIHESVNNNAGAVTAGAPITAGASAGVDTGLLGTVAAAGTLVGICTKGAASGAKLQWIGV